MRDPITDVILLPVLLSSFGITASEETELRQPGLGSVNSPLLIAEDPNQHLHKTTRELLNKMIPSGRRCGGTSTHMTYVFVVSSFQKTRSAVTPSASKNLPVYLLVSWKLALTLMTVYKQRRIQPLSRLRTEGVSVELGKEADPDGERWSIFI